MKNFKLRLILLCLATVLTLGLSHQVAQASCVQIDAGANAYGRYDCRLKYTCGGWCYYTCVCTNVFPGFSCDDVLQEAGFETSYTPDCLVV